MIYVVIAISVGRAAEYEVETEKVTVRLDQVNG